MNPLAIGVLYGGATLVTLFAGVPIAFALGAVAVAFMIVFMPVASLGTVAQNVYQEIANITLLTIPLFILKGAAIGRSRAGADLYKKEARSLRLQADVENLNNRLNVLDFAGLLSASAIAPPRSYFLRLAATF